MDVVSQLIGQCYRREHDSLRENYPLLEMNDVIYMRRIRDEDQMSQFFERPDWDGNEYIGIVHAVRRAAGQVTIRCEPLAEELGVPLTLPVNVKHTLGNRFNIRFQPQGVSRCLHRLPSADV